MSTVGISVHFHKPSLYCTVHLPARDMRASSESTNKTMCFGLLASTGCAPSAAVFGIRDFKAFWKNSRTMSSSKYAKDKRLHQHYAPENILTQVNVLSCYRYISIELMSLMLLFDFINSSQIRWYFFKLGDMLDCIKSQKYATLLQFLANIFQYLFCWDLWLLSSWCNFLVESEM